MRAATAKVVVAASVGAAVFGGADQSPYLWHVFPPGARQGSEVELTISGMYLEGASEVHVGGRGVTGQIVKLALQEETKKRRTGKKRRQKGEKWYRVTVRVKVDRKAELGIHDLRLVTSHGVSNAFRFFVGDLPELTEAEPNDAIIQAHALPSLPCVVNGRIMPGDRDVFSFTATQGQTIVCALLGRAILPYIADAVPGWIQACLTLYDAEGKECAYVDDFLFDPDPVLFFSVPKDGRYFVKIHDSLYRGREDFLYRMRIGALPYITYRFPLGGRQGQNVRVELGGVNLCEKTVALDIPKKPQSLVPVQITCNGIASNVVPFEVGQLPEVTEKEPNDTATQAQELTLPLVVSGRIQSPGDHEYFAFQAPAGAVLVAEVKARRLGSPLDSYLVLLDERGRRLAFNDDTKDPSAGLVTHHADAILTYTVRRAGTYVLWLRDTQGKGGPAYGYRLRVSEAQPDFSLMVSPDNPQVPRGGTGKLTLHAVRRDGFTGPIDIAVSGLPEGFTVNKAVVPEGQNEAPITITAPEGASQVQLRPRFYGTATVGSRKIKREAVPVRDWMQAFIYHHLVPVEELVLTVAAAKSVALRPILPEGGVVAVPQGGQATVRVAVTRKGAAKEVVRLSAENVPRGLVVRRATVPAAKGEAAVLLTSTRQLKVGFRCAVVLTGALRQGIENVTVYSPAIPIEVITPKGAGKAVGGKARKKR